MTRYGSTLLRSAVLALCLASAPALAIDGPRSNATVSFGAWMSSPPLDRFPNSSPPPTNHHELIPNQVTIKAGGSVNFIVSGFHSIAIYDDGTRPTDINVGMLAAPTGGFGPPLIADPMDRIYRGPDPSLLPVDRVEVVHFAEPGLYLVICAVLPHFGQGMYGYVRVLP